MKKVIYLGADHNGYIMKEKLKTWLTKKNISFSDLGDLLHDQNDDYPDYAEAVARKVAKEKTFGILICGSAQGMCIAANKIKGVRAVIPTTLREVRFCRLHDDANILCLSGWFLPYYQATKLIDAFLKIPFSKEKRHVRRLKKIEKLEK